MMDIGALRMAQQDGGAPTTVAAGSAPGESGVSVLNFRFDGGIHLLAAARSHCICFQMSQVRVEKRMVGRVAHYEHRAGSLSITPSGCDIGAALKPGLLIWNSRAKPWRDHKPVQRTRRGLDTIAVS
jgi:AraC family transcriptional regulator